MTSHGVARSTRAPRTKEQRHQDIERIRKYRALEDQARSRVAEKQLDQDTFLLTSQLLRLNPEYYTIWNVRRRCLTSGILYGASHNPSPSSSAETRSSLNPKESNSGSPTLKPCVGDASQTPQKQIEGVIRSELGFTVPLLIEYPKCYWIWKYRLWILDQATDKLSTGTARAIWEEELGLVSKMLLKDRRSAVESEFDYTTKAIHEDLSNFSAWHNRSQLIPRLLRERGADNASRKEFLDDELDTIREALNVGPEDQSLWYYHHYLCFNLIESSGSRAIVPHMPAAERKTYVIAEIANIRELAKDFRDIKWVYEALIEYTLAIIQLDSRSVQNEEKREISQWLAKLRELDRKRSGRWDDFETQLGLT
ncbi:protein prenyltransferase alpha subunit repeat domain-containing protein [Hirsutella rhossiliensis]|uniref:Geranylgeranyl transferase type-2 subunit alpha n=1 Tax=Hirsutella rhossiliensis TaxID=111463 RepID=A0A9P8MUI6_9HYPO|nr:protein prenyltransferase alpha subunit repeat domain-containing protein [Hirsutella rhossiliensis]KAH0960689.1 protein prenyltransferase alpha subunit repeat domain-containing protein [Hirsutella rhossiliensis]